MGTRVTLESTILNITSKPRNPESKSKKPREQIQETQRVNPRNPESKSKKLSEQNQETQRVKPKNTES
jgi:hypothetical protein